MNDKIKKLREEIEREELKIKNCKHDFNEPFYNPETKLEPYGFKTVGHGSDVYTEEEGYREVKKDRWTRKCKICGYEQHTDNQEPVISAYRPKFY